MTGCTSTVMFLPSKATHCDRQAIGDGRLAAQLQVKGPQHLPGLRGKLWRHVGPCVPDVFAQQLRICTAVSSSGCN